MHDGSQVPQRLLHAVSEVVVVGRGRSESARLRLQPRGRSSQLHPQLRRQAGGGGCRRARSPEAGEAFGGLEAP